MHENKFFASKIEEIYIFDYRILNLLIKIYFYSVHHNCLREQILVIYNYPLNIINMPFPLLSIFFE